jgi:hypothetical protein
MLPNSRSRNSRDLLVSYHPVIVMAELEDRTTLALDHWGLLCESLQRVRCDCDMAHGSLTLPCAQMPTRAILAMTMYLWGDPPGRPYCELLDPYGCCTGGSGITGGSGSTNSSRRVLS